MKILVISDTHGNHENLDAVVRLERPFDRVIHLGDIEGEEAYLESACGCPVDMVRGNNDYFSTLPSERSLDLNGKHVLITHGHEYCVSAGVELLVMDARGRNMDMVMFGHTHRPLLRRDKEITVLNPGSLSYPRQEGRRPSYIIMELDPDGNAEFFLKYL